MKNFISTSLFLFIVFATSIGLQANNKSITVENRLKHGALGLTKAAVSMIHLAGAGYISYVFYYHLIDRCRLHDSRKDPVAYRRALILSGLVAALGAPAFLADAYTFGKSSLKSFKRAFAEDSAKQDHNYGTEE